MQMVQHASALAQPEACFTFPPSTPICVSKPNSARWLT